MVNGFINPLSGMAALPSLHWSIKKTQLPGPSSMTQGLPHDRRAQPENSSESITLPSDCRSEGQRKSPQHSTEKRQIIFFKTNNFVKDMP